MRSFVLTTDFTSHLLVAQVVKVKLCLGSDTTSPAGTKSRLLGLARKVECEKGLTLKYRLNLSV